MTDRSLSHLSYFRHLRDSSLTVFNCQSTEWMELATEKWGKKTMGMQKRGKQNLTVYLTKPISDFPSDTFKTDSEDEIPASLIGSI